MNNQHKRMGKRLGLGLAASLLLCAGAIGCGGSDELGQEASASSSSTSSGEGGDASGGGGPTGQGGDSAGGGGTAEVDVDLGPFVYIGQDEPGWSAQRKLFADAGDGPIQLSEADQEVPYGAMASPNNKYAAYKAESKTGNSGTFIASTDGNELVKLKESGDFVWTPDSSRLVYKPLGYTPAKDSRLYSVLPDGSGRTQLVEGAVSLPSFSADSKHMAFMKQDGVYVGGPDGSSPPVKVVEHNGTNAWVLRWSPDSKRLAVQIDADPNAAGQELYTVDSDGSNLAQLSNEDVRRFVWASDSSRIAFTTDANADGTGEMRVAASDGSGKVLVSAAGDTIDKYEKPFWSPNSTWSAYRTDDKSQLRVAKADGSGSTLVSGAASLPGEITRGVWAPSKPAIAFRAAHETADTTELYVASADGTSKTKASIPLSPGQGVGGFFWQHDELLLYAAEGSIHEHAQMNFKNGGMSLPELVESLKVTSKVLKGFHHDDDEIEKWRESETNFAMVIFKKDKGTEGTELTGKCRLKETLPGFWVVDICSIPGLMWTEASKDKKIISGLSSWP